MTAGRSSNTVAVQWGLLMADGNTTAKPRRARRAKGPTTPDPIEIAMGAEASGKAPGGVAAEVLKKQSTLIGWEIADRRAAFGLKALLGLAGLATAAVLAAMAWSASRADGLIVEAFLVPPQLAARGATGEVVARTVLDRLGELDRSANSLHSVRVADAWTQDTKIDLPQTGVSLDELQRLLRRWLGRETYLTGEVVQTPSGVRLTARTGVGRTVSVEGAADALPALAREAAEALFREARPVQYAEHLVRQGRGVQVRPLLGEVLRTDTDPLTRAYAAHVMALTYDDEAQYDQARGWYMRAAESPNPLLASLALQFASNDAAARGLDRESAALRRQAEKRLGSSHGPTAAWYRAGLKANVVADRGDYLEASRILRPYVGVANLGTTGTYRNTYGWFLAALHETTAARRLTGGRYPTAEFYSENWPVTLAIARAARARGDVSPRSRALEAVSLARLGQPQAALAALQGTPDDCFFCVVARGAALSQLGDVAGSEQAFAAAERLNPEQPILPVTWGRMRLERGDARGALEMFRLGQARFPRYADPLAWAGEALLVLGDAKAAEAELRKAAPLAPRWGRLQLTWGEALAAQGKADEARAKWRAAMTMDLTAAERARVQALLQQRTT